MESGAKRDFTEEEAERELSSRDMYRIILAAACGSLIEWYDFFVFGSLATVISSKFYHTGTSTGDTIAWLATFATGFFFRPLGALVFGVIGDLCGRKHTFLICLLIMGLGTTLVGMLPTIDSIGTTASVLLIILRITQGLAIGGEWGGACTYIAESSPPQNRGYFTSFLQITASLGLLLSLVVIMLVKVSMSADSFSQWGWRLPFLLSIILSFYIRRKMQESPVYIRSKKKQARKLEGKKPGNPLVESFTSPKNLYYVVLALFGAVMGMAVIWYTAQFYSLTYIQTNMGVELNESYIIVGVALALASPLFILVGYLSDTYGRKPFMLSGLFLGAMFIYPLFMGMRHFGLAKIVSEDKLINLHYWFLINQPKNNPRSPL